MLFLTHSEAGLELKGPAEYTMRYTQVDFTPVILGVSAGRYEVRDKFVLSANKTIVAYSQR